MFGKNLTLFEIFGFKIRVNLTWTFLALLIAWTLALGVFPALYEGLPPATYWSMAIVGVIGLFFSIIFHELAHSLVGRLFGIEMKGITLFMFGGMAEMEEEPRSPKGEFLMAIAGPISSFFLAAVFYGTAALVSAAGGGEPMAGVLSYLGLLNIILAIFNLVPAFPLDGGRALRAALWYWKGQLRWATRIASQVGATFGLLLVALGILSAVSGNLIGGIWWLLIGLFIRAAANASYQQMETRRLLEGEPVSRFMTSDPVTVSPDVSVRELVDDYIYRHHHEVYPVVERGRALGCVNSRRIRDLPREAWESTPVRDVMSPRTSENSVRAEEDAVRALAKMRGQGNSRLMVVTHDDRLVGIIALKDILKLLELRMDLEPENGRDTADQR